MTKTMNTVKFRRTKALVYSDGKVSVARYNTMRHALDIIKNLPAKTVKGIALFNGEDYQETIELSGLSDISKVIKSKLIQALDSMGLALANKNHFWTDEERKLYETAVSLLK